MSVQSGTYNYLHVKFCQVPVNMQKDFNLLELLLLTAHIRSLYHNPLQICKISDL